MERFGGKGSLIERAPQMSEAEQKLHALLVPENEKQRIKIEDFEDLYGKDVIKRDQATVARLEKIFEDQRKEDPQAKVWAERGALFEAIMNNQIEESNWLGDNASVFVPSRYDDIENGIDSVIEFKEEAGKSHLALAIDITKSSRELDKKIDRIRDSIKDGKLSRVKYFDSPEIRGELKERLRVVVGADQDTIREITDLLLTFKTRQKFPDAGKPGEFKSVRKNLENHRLQFIVLFEIREQLENFGAYASKIGRVEIAQKYQQALDVINRILNEKDHEYDTENHPDLQQDGVYSLIVERAKAF